MQHEMISVSDEEMTETLTYWTDERMDQARPAPLRVVPAGEVGQYREDTTPGGTSDAFAPSGEMSTGLSSSTPYKTDPNTRPFWNCGRIFFTDPQTGEDYWGSAAFTGHPYVIMTAAHNVVENGVYFTKLLFYRSAWGMAIGTYGQKIAIKAKYTPGQWNSFGDERYDYAFLRAAEQSGAGWVGLDCRGCNLHADCTCVGYPQNYGASGKDMYAVEGCSRPAGVLIRMLGNPFNFGASGGPWIINFSSAYAPENNMAIAITTQMDLGGVPAVYSPAFDSNTFGLFAQCRDYTGAHPL
ncbi:trypsin-like serine peptidase [Streptomyces sp. AA1529]|uniref:trypsin-like serine peptidase n=1 Tax=Streptomyces sp. AA1529 TaxID=1203257 RepID=UPI003D726FD9